MIDHEDDTHSKGAIPFWNKWRFINVAVLLRVDGVMSFTFGLATTFFQLTIFRTVVDLKTAGVTGRGDSLMESALLTLSGYYMLVGAILLLLAQLPRMFAKRLCMVIALHHAFMAVKGAYEANRAWVTGNPWWDVAIHTAFVMVYAYYLFVSVTKPQIP